MSKFLIGVASLALLTATSAHAGPNLIANGGFEAGSGTTIPDWSVTHFGTPDANSILLIKGSAYAGIGGYGSAGALANQFASFGAGDSSNLARLGQVFQTSQTGQHVLDFDFGAYGGEQTMGVSLFDFALGSFIFAADVTRPGTANLDALFQGYSFSTSLEAGKTYGLFFSNAASLTGSRDAFVDNVSLAAVPEPTTWAMMIGGLAVVGLSMRRRSLRANIQFA